MKIPNALLEATRQRQVVIFAGAGISRQAVGLSGRSLRDALAADIKKDYEDYDVAERSLEDVCDEYQVVNDRSVLVNRIADLFPARPAPTPAHLAAVRMFRFIVTTNWDRLFELAADAVGNRYRVLASEADVPNFNFDNHNLLKIHGSIEHPTTLVCTTEDYELYPETHPQMLERVAGLLYGYTVLYVGYGLRDEHLRALLSRIRRQRGDWGRRAYVVGSYDTVRCLLLKERKMEVIDAQADDFLPALAQQAGFD
jgi:hypothetical protein